MAELPQPVLAIVPTQPRMVRNLFTGFRKADVNKCVYTLFAFGTGSDPASVLRESGVVSVPFSASPNSHHVELNLDGIVILPEDIDTATGIDDCAKTLLKANKMQMRTEEFGACLYNGEATAVYLGTLTYNLSLRYS